MPSPAKAPDIVPNIESEREETKAMAEGLVELYRTGIFSDLATLLEYVKDETKPPKITSDTPLLPQLVKLGKRMKEQDYSGRLGLCNRERDTTQNDIIDALTNENALEGFLYFLGLGSESTVRKLPDKEGLLTKASKLGQRIADLLAEFPENREKVILGVEFTLKVNQRRE